MSSLPGNADGLIRAMRGLVPKGGALMYGRYPRGTVAQKCLLMAGIVLGASATDGMAAISLDLGIPAPIGWQGTGSRYFAPPGNLLGEDVNLGAPNSESHVSVDDETGIIGWADTYPWQMHGYIDSYDPEVDIQQIGGFFRDEIYVASASGNPVRVEFEILLDFSFDNLIFEADWGESSAEILLSMGYYPDGENSFSNGTYQQLDRYRVSTTPVLNEELSGDPEEPPFFYNTYIIEEEDWDLGSSTVTELDEVESYFGFSGTVLLTTDGHSDGGLVASGTWLPISVGLWGFAQGAIVDWSSSMVLGEVRVYDGFTDALLGPEDYSVVSFNDNFPSNGVVPEPSTGALFVMFLALGAVRSARWRSI